jgi:hypothetical protein
VGQKGDDGIGIKLVVFLRMDGHILQIQSAEDIEPLL